VTIEVFRVEIMRRFGRLVVNCGHLLATRDNIGT